MVYYGFQPAHPTDGTLNRNLEGLGATMLKCRNRNLAGVGRLSTYLPVVDQVRT